MRSMQSSGVSSVATEVTRMARGERVRRGEQGRKRRRGAAREMLELELIGRKHVGGRHRALAQELRDSGAHIDAAAGIADHRIAAIRAAGLAALTLASASRIASPVSGFPR